MFLFCWRIQTIPWKTGNKVTLKGTTMWEWRVALHKSNFMARSDQSAELGIPAASSPSLLPTVGWLQSWTLALKGNCGGTWAPQSQSVCELDFISHLLISEIEKLLENFTFWDNRMATHSRHPSLQPLHAHFDKFFFKAPCYTLNNNCYIYRLAPSNFFF